MFNARHDLPACFFITPNDLQDEHLRGFLGRLIRQEVLDCIVITEAQTIAAVRHPRISCQASLLFP